MTNEDNKELSHFEALKAKDGINQPASEPELTIASAPQIGHGRVDKSLMPFGGKQYPENMEFDVRLAGVNEIRHWSTVSDNMHPTKLYTYFNDIVQKCVKVHGGTWQDIKEADRLWFVMYIHELTFIEAERPAVLNARCKNTSCGEEFKAKLYKEIIQFDTPDEAVHKYINKATGSFHLQTKSYGEVILTIPTLKTGVALMAYYNKQKEDWIEKNTTFLDIATYMIQPHQTPTEGLFNALYADYMSWDSKKLSTMIGLVAKVKLVPRQTFKVKCPKCGSETDQALDLEGGIRSIFLPVSDIADELI
ncbi:hypothetical protein MA9V2_059 [Chryseobacterium phage MA9V-2]|nr:hypothetical protein MA9V2_059 [Chryseobacterium phage MA9V-2]